MQCRHRLIPLIWGVMPGLCGAAQASDNPFPSGVMAGDVTQSAALCWTQTGVAESLRLEVASDDGFKNIVASAAIATDADADFTAKYDVHDLSPATRYFFRFVRARDGVASPVGTFRTAPPPDAPAALRFIFTGDSNARHQPFRVFDFAQAEQPDLWFWYGDTIYGDVPAGPLGVATTLDDYRAKYRQNLGDPHLQGMLTAAPVWAGWDDHEVANDYDGGDPEPDLSRDRIAAAYQAFFEHMPVRPQGIAGDERRVYRSFRYGALAEFFILDGRQYRSADAARLSGGGLGTLDPFGFFVPILRNHRFVDVTRDPDRTMLGKTQLEWLKQAVIGSTARFKFIINPVPFTSLLVYPQDRWDGYDAERYDLLRTLDLAGVEGVIVLTTDTHANTVNPDVTRFQRVFGGRRFSRRFAVPELIAGPIATDTLGGEARGVVVSLLGGPGNPFAEVIARLAEWLVEQRVIAANGMTFADSDHYAYLLVDVDDTGVTLTHRGIPANDADTDSPIRSLNRVMLDEHGRAPRSPCVLFPLIGLICLHARLGRGVRFTG